MKEPKAKNATRLIPRYKLTLDPAFLAKHWHDIANFALHAETAEPLDMVIEFVPGTTKLTGRVQFIHPGHSKLMADFIKTLKEAA